MGLLANMKKLRKKKKSVDEDYSKRKSTKQEVIEIEDTVSDKSSDVLTYGAVNKRDFIAPSAFHLGEARDGDWMKVGGKFVRPFTLHRYPASSYVKWLDTLYNHQGDLDIAVHIHPAEERAALEELNDNIIVLESQIYEEERSGRVSRISKLQMDREKLVAQRRVLEENTQKLFYVQVAGNLYADSEKELNREFQVIQNRLGGSNMGVQPTYLRQTDGYRTALPYGKSYLEDRFRNLNSNAVATLFPFYNSEIMHTDGVFVGFNATTSAPIIMNFFNNRILPNPNINVFGKSGSGKSFFVSLLTMRSAARGIRTLIIDPEGEFETITNNLGGKRVVIARGSENFINPFDVEAEVDPDSVELDPVTGEPNLESGVKTVNVGDKISELLNLVELMGHGLPSHVSSIVSEVLQETYAKAGITSDADSLLVEGESIVTEDESGEILFSPEYRRKEMPTFGDFHKLLDNRAQLEDDLELKNLVQTLKQFTKGSLYGMFDTQTSHDLRNLEDAPIITFDISKLEADSLIRPIGMYIVMQWAWEKFAKKDMRDINNNPIKKRIVCDEAWMMVNPNMAGFKLTAKFLETTARRIRKRNGSLLVASQNFREFTQSSEGKAVLSNSETKFLLGQDPNDLDSIQGQFRLSDGEVEFLQGAGLGQFLIKTTLHSAHGNVVAFPAEQEIIQQSKTFIKA